MMSNMPKIHLALNVSKADAEYLYDEIEGLIVIGFENVIVSLNQPPGADEYETSKKLMRIINDKSLSGYLSEKLGQVIEVIEVTPWINYLSPLDVPGMILKIRVPVEWAMSFGKPETKKQLNNILEFLKGEQEPGDSTLNGEQIDPVTGALYYDNSSQKMKMWNGVIWVDPKPKLNTGPHPRLSTRT